MRNSCELTHENRRSPVSGLSRRTPGRRLPYIALLWLTTLSLLLLPYPARAQTPGPADAPGAALDGECADDLSLDTLLIGVESGASVETLAAALHTQGMDLVRFWPAFGLAEARMIAQKPHQPLDATASLDRLASQRQAVEALPSVRYADYDRRVTAADQVTEFPEIAGADLPLAPVPPNDPLFDQQWALSKMRVVDAWNITQGAGGMVIAVIDSGYDQTHEDLSPDSLWTNRVEANGEPLVDDDDNTFIDDVHGWDWVENDGVMNDPYGHGTHVGGSISATTNNRLGVAGLAPGLKVMPLRVLDEYGSGQVSDLIDALYYAFQSGARVANLSLVLRYDSPALHDAVLAAQAGGLLVVAASGNYGSVVYWPAAYPETLAVAATDSNDRRAAFSNAGPQVDVAAPGVDILSTYLDNDYHTQSGTSMATPQVAALAGLIWNLRPDLTDDGVIDLIRRTAVDVNADSAPGFDNEIGYGRVDYEAALQEAASRLIMAPHDANNYIVLAGEPTVIPIDVTALATDGEALPVAGAVVHYALNPVQSDAPTEIMGRAVSGEDGVATIAFLSPALGGEYELSVQMGPNQAVIPVTVTAEPAWVRVTPPVATAAVGDEVLTLVVAVVDDADQPVLGELPLRMETDLGHWGDGQQVWNVIMEDGHYEAAFYPGEEAGRATLRFSVGQLGQAVSVDIAPGAAERIQMMAQEPPALVSAGIRGMDLAFAVEDRFANPVVDGTSVRFFASAGQLTPGEVGTRDGRVVTTLRVPADADSPVQVWVVVPGARAQLEVTIPVMSHQVWLPIAGAQ
jgi:subtilisin family serine protease